MGLWKNLFEFYYDSNESMALGNQEAPLNFNLKQDN